MPQVSLHLFNSTYPVLTQISMHSLIYNKTEQIISGSAAKILCNLISALGRPTNPAYSKASIRGVMHERIQKGGQGVRTPP